jgi:L-ascorbate metabolism protein UlaG (beta-lactamase superfamily)
MADRTTFTWYGHSCFELHTPAGKVVLFDPWFGNPTSPKAAAAVERCDVLLVSHGHFDHIGSGPRQVKGADALAIARRTKPVWPCMHELSLWLETELEGAGVDVVGMNKGGTFDAHGLPVTMTHADHSAGDWLPSGEPMTGWRRTSEGPLYLGEPAGFVLTMEDGLRIYYSGDTDLFGDMALIGEMHHPDVAIMPIGGHYTMGPAGAARAAKLLGVKTVIPVHYGTFPILAGTPAELRSELAALGVAAEVVAPVRGVATALG